MERCGRWELTDLSLREVEICLDGFREEGREGEPREAVCE